MLLKHWLTSLQHHFRKPSRTARRKGSPQHHAAVKPVAAQAEVLEQRVLLTDFVVTTPVDSVDDTDDLVSLREAIISANDDSPVNDDVTMGGTPDLDTISFDASIAGSTITLDDNLGQLEITDDLEIDGADPLSIGLDITISGDNLIRIFSINTSGFVGDDHDVLLTNLILTSGNTSGSTGDDGGAVLVTDGEDVSLDSVTISNSTAVGNGGAIAAGNGTLTVDNSQIGDLSAGGNQAVNGGGISVDGGTLNLDNTIVSSNTATGGTATTNGGGGIYSLGGTVTLENSSMLSGNSATGSSGSGGGILANGGLLDITDSTIENNEASRAGGGIETNDATTSVTVDVTTSDLQNNTAASNPGNGGGLHITSPSTSANTTTVTITGGTVSGNSAAAEGGGIWNDVNGTLTLNGVVIDGNTASGILADQGGGGVFNNGGMVTIQNDSTTATTISGNIADGTAGSGGGILNDGGTLMITDAQIAANTANRAGGGIEVTTANDRDSTVSLDGVGLLNNNAVGGPTMAPGNGGGVHISDGAGGNSSTFDIIGGTVGGNSAAAEGGGLWNAIGGTLNINGVTIMNNTASGVSADQGGGGIFNEGGTVTIQNDDTTASTISGNIANGTAGSGGGILNDGGTLEITNATLLGNTANRAGGGIEVTTANSRNSTVMLTDTTIMANSALGGSTMAPGNGGGVHISDAAGDETSTFTMTRGSISLNSAAAEGGGLWNAVGGTMNLRGVDIASNTASGDDADQGGGGIFNEGGTLNIQNSATTATLIRNNTANGASGSGAGILNDGGTITMTGGTIQTNSAARAGGGIEVTTANGRDSVVTLNRVMIGMNIAASNPGNGGGVHISDAAGDETSTFTLNRGAVSNNVAAEEGGGLWNDVGGTLNINGTTISNNTANGDDADQGGGGIFNNGGMVNIQDSGTITTISGNVANGGTMGSGGGILNDGGTVTMTGGLISGNSAARAGGGIEVTTVNERDSLVMLTDTVISGNVASSSPGNGGGVHISDAEGDESSTFTITGGAVVGNYASAEGGGFWNDGGGTLNIDGTLIESNTAVGVGADQGGGGIFNEGGMVNITSTTATTTISGNVAGAGGTSSASGGGILNDGGMLSIDGALIDGNAAMRAGGAIEVTTANGRDSVVNVTNTTISNNQVGSAPGNGGGVHISDAAGDETSTFNLTGSTVSGNSAAAEGGGLWNAVGGTLTITGSTITGNTASGDSADQGGGGVFNEGGTVMILQGTTASTTISNNVADGAAGSGGGILNDGGTLSISGTVIGTNTAMRAGGGIEATTANGRDSDITITMSTLSNNAVGSAPGNGGGVHISDPAGGNSSFFSISGSSITDNSAASEGGGLWNDADGVMLITGTTVSGNTASGNSATNGGGGLFNNGGRLVVSGSSLITSNVADGSSGSGGGIFNDTGGVLEVLDSSILSNTANRAGGGVEDNAGTSTVLANVMLDSNVASGMGNGPGNGGGLHMTGPGTVTIVGGTVSNNSAASEGGGLWNSSSGTLTVTGDVDGPLTNPDPNISEATGAMASTIQGAVDAFRTALGTDNGGAPGSLAAGRRQIDWDGVPDDSASPNAFPGDFFNAPTTGRARGAEFTTPGTGFQVSADSSVGDVEFDNINNTYSNAFGTFSAERLFTPIGSNITDVKFFIPGTDIPALVSGFGAVFTDVDTAGSTKIEFFDVEDNLLTSRTVLETSGDESFSFTGVRYNDAVIARVRITAGSTALGMGVNDDNGTTNDLVVMDDFIFGEPVPIPTMKTVIDSNTASGNDSTNGGGGIFNDGGTVNIRSATISNNSADGTDGQGGGIFNGPGPIFTFIPYAGQGGGMTNGFNGGGGSVNVFQTTLSGNDAANNGGGVFSQGPMMVGDSTVSGNSAVNNGGGIWNSNTLDLSQVTVSGNTADMMNGGGIYTEAASTLNIANSTITLNQATNGDGGGVSNDNSTVTLQSTIIAENTAGTTTNDVNGSVQGTSQFNLIGDGTGLTGITGGSGDNQIGTSGTPIDPLLGPLANNGGPTQTHTLLPDSPAINAGDNPNNLDFDQRGEGFPRSLGSQTDIGAVEVQVLITAVGAGPGLDKVKVFNSLTGEELATVTPYPGFMGGIRVAVGDVNGDGALDLITGAGPGGGPHVKVFDGSSENFMTEIESFFPFDIAFSGGVFVAAANFNPDEDNNADIVIGADAGGGPNVVVRSGADTDVVMQNFFPFALGFTGGVRVGTGDINHDDVPDIITAAGPGGGPHVRVFDGSIPQSTTTPTDIGGVNGSFFPYSPGFSGGVFVAGGDINDDGRDDIIAGPGAGGGPHVVVRSGLDGSTLFSFFAYNSAFTGGVRVAAAQGPDNDGVADIVTGPGQGGGPNLRIFSGAGVSGTTPTQIADYNIFDAGFTGGIFVGGGLPLTESTGGSPLRFGGGLSTGDPTLLSQSQADALAQGALTRLETSGASPAAIQALSSVTVRITDLEDGVLGRALPGVIYIDVNASGAGWFVDATPLDDGEFDANLNAIDLSSIGRVDLLTVLLHEFGHQLGADDLGIFEHPGHLMAESLPTGQRRLPTGDLDALFADGHLIDSLLN